MHLDDFDYELPEGLIAQFPASQRDASRLMCLDRHTGAINVAQFTDIPGYFEEGDVLVVNDTRVIPARLLGRKPTGGKVEIFLVRQCALEDESEWFCLTKSNKPLQPGTRVEFDEGFSAEILAEAEAPYRRVRFYYSGDFLTRVDQIGHLPLPPYIKRDDGEQDKSRYQTVFAKERGAVAAPTAGLHFTAAILEQIRQRGVEICSLTLHVGLGTFLPVRVDNIREHKMHAEFYAISEQTAQQVNRARRTGKRVIALGTTSARALETAATADGRLEACSGDSEIFIYPGYEFKLVDALVTNFHLPKSTLLMLVSALAGREHILAAYSRAIAENFRFFSYGDCMLIS
jgi:S-adenosylmethionine:tRNA ribosyltransferase-isomerase